VHPKASKASLICRLICCLRWSTASSMWGTVSSRFHSSSVYSFIKNMWQSEQFTM